MRIPEIYQPSGFSNTLQSNNEKDSRRPRASTYTLGQKGEKNVIRATRWSTKDPLVGKLRNFYFYLLNNVKVK